MGGYVEKKDGLSLITEWNLCQNITFPSGKNSKIQASISKQMTLYHLKITFFHCFLLGDVQNLIITVWLA